MTRPDSVAIAPGMVLISIQLVLVIGLAFTWIANVNNAQEDTRAMRIQYSEMKEQLSKLNITLERISDKIDHSENQILLWLNKGNEERSAIIVLLKQKFPNWEPPRSEPIYWAR